MLRILSVELFETQNAPIPICLYKYLDISSYIYNLSKDIIPTIKPREMPHGQ